VPNCATLLAEEIREKGLPIGHTHIRIAYCIVYCNSVNVDSLIDGTIRSKKKPLFRIAQHNIPIVCHDLVRWQNEIHIIAFEARELLYILQSEKFPAITQAEEYQKTNEFSVDVPHHLPQYVVSTC
jgi:hypothetical protein